MQVLSLSTLCEHPRYSGEPVRGLRGAPRTSPRTLVKDRNHQQALMWYNRSLSKLRRSLEKGTVNNTVALISCILYICIELLQDNEPEVVQLYHHGASIISNCNASFLEEGIASLLYNFSALALVMDYVPPDKVVKPVSETRDHFSNLEEAEVVLYQFLPQIVAHYKASANVLLTGKQIEEHQLAELEAQKNSLCAALDQWLQSFRALGITLEGHASQTEKFAVAKLLQARATLRVGILASTTLSEMVNDDLVDDFEEILRYGRYGIAATQYPDGTQPPFSLETSIALPLFVCVIQCRDYRIRHEALDLLHRAPKVQGLCKSAHHALMASRIISIEEAGLQLVDRRDGTGSEMFIPESHRISNVTVTSKKNVDGRDVWALQYSRNLSDGVGDYQIVEELSPFDPSDVLSPQQSTSARVLMDETPCGIHSQPAPLEGSANSLKSRGIRQLMVSPLRDGYA